MSGKQDGDSTKPDFVGLNRFMMDYVAAAKSGKIGGKGKPMLPQQNLERYVKEIDLSPEIRSELEDGCALLVSPGCGCVLVPAADIREDWRGKVIDVGNEMMLKIQRQIGNTAKEIDSGDENQDSRKA